VQFFTCTKGLLGLLELLGLFGLLGLLRLLGLLWLLRFIAVIAVIRLQGYYSDSSPYVRIVMIDVITSLIVFRPIV
jgi:hypothetical protein